MIRKTAHVIEYTGLGFVLAIVCYYIKVKWYWKIIGLPMLVCGLPSMDELVQRYSNREGRVSDVIIDLCGEGIGLLLGVALVGLFCAILHGSSNRKDHDKLQEGKTQVVDDKLVES